MEYAKLGKSDLLISKIGFGCMSLKPEKSSFEYIIHAALDKGINYFDTADLYDKGLNETLLGAALKGHRNKVVIASKAGNQWRADGSGWDWNPRKDYILKCADASLKRLGIEYIDLFQSHGGTIDDDIDETIDAFETLVKQGKIRYYGLSSIRPNVIREYIKKSQIVSVMTQYSLLDRRPQEFTLPALQENGIGVLVRGSVSQGLLIDKPAKDYLNYSADVVTTAAAAINDASSHTRSASQTAIRFVLKNSAVTSVVVGMRTIEQLKDAAGVFSSPELSDSEMGRLAGSIPVNFYDQHR